MSPQAVALLTMVEQVGQQAERCENGQLLTAVRDYLAEHRDQMSANTMWLADGLAYLSRRGEYVDLCIIGRGDDLPVFILDLTGWREVPNLDRRYAEWSAKC